MLDFCLPCYFPFWIIFCPGRILAVLGAGVAPCVKGLMPASRLISLLTLPFLFTVGVTLFVILNIPLL